ncbi:MAG TPA: TerB family tellurite resistance protein, partial [Terriglobia bacterium]|nr:TerB family tellurite resistance protein [Terriglobia bacterium]
MSIWDLFRVEPTQRPPSASTETESVRRITEVLDQMQPDHARYIAAFAYILSRVARSDQDVSPEETRAMEEIVAKQGDFGEEQAIIVVQMAKMQSTLFSGIEDYVVTREFNGIASREQKIALLH